MCSRMHCKTVILLWILNTMHLLQKLQQPQTIIKAEEEGQEEELRQQCGGKKQNDSNPSHSQCLSAPPCALSGLMGKPN